MNVKKTLLIVFREPYQHDKTLYKAINKPLKQIRKVLIIMMSQKELQKYAEQDYKLVDPEYIKQLERDSEKLIKFKKYSILAVFIAVIVIAVTLPLLRALLTNLLN